MPEVFTESGIVSNCTRNEDTCCYGCFCNYYKQTEQHELSHERAKGILESLF